MRQSLAVFAGSKEGRAGRTAFRQSLQCRFGGRLCCMQSAPHTNQRCDYLRPVFTLLLPALRGLRVMPLRALRLACVVAAVRTTAAPVRGLFLPNFFADRKSVV